ncbi:type II toxin-antitoxin system MqsR family toxin [Pseudomonas asiatica]|uniref:type II toxin-antitoxin system MqsR family toxin n=1 Tax=Pseudomonas asiatica TaxID=2219225 RepID=UPI002AC8C8FD|nr:type II toxin-antitoxin system MqsR family toxin [Pseudomonas asiatica]
MEAQKNENVGPTYNLENLKKTVKDLGKKSFTGSSMAGIAELGMTVEDAIDCIDCLCIDDFYKTMPSMKDPGHFQDVYHGKYWSEEIYIKFTGYTVGPVVISFKEK